MKKKNSYNSSAEAHMVSYLALCVSVSTAEVILTPSYFHPRMQLVCLREVVASVVSGLLLLQVLVGVDTEKVVAVLPDTLLIPPRHGTIYPPAFLFSFPIWSPAKWDKARGNCHIFAWMAATALRAGVSTACSLCLSLCRSLLFLFLLSFSFSLSFHWKIKQPTPTHHLPIPCLAPLPPIRERYHICWRNICNFGLQNR